MSDVKPAHVVGYWQAAFINDIAESFRKAAESFAQRGIRSLAVLRKRESDPWHLTGLLPLTDPVRWDANHAVERLHDLGVTVKLTTGSLEFFAQTVADEVGLGRETLELREFVGEQGLDTRLNDRSDEAIQTADSLCAVFPEDKVTICRALQRGGHSVAMTGDGASDAPSLEIANCGLAVEGAAEKAQKAADIVFLKPGITVITNAIAAARRHFRLVESFLIHRAGMCSYLVTLVFLYYSRFGKTIHPEYIYFITCLDDVVQTAFSQLQGSDGPAERRPAKLQVRRLWRIGGPLFFGLVIITSTMLTLLPSGNSEMFCKTIFLTTMVASHGSFLLRYTRGESKSYHLYEHAILTLLAFEIVAAGMCVFPWKNGDRPLYLMTATEWQLAIVSALASSYQLWSVWRAEKEEQEQEDE